MRREKEKGKGIYLRLSMLRLCGYVISILNLKDHKGAPNPPSFSFFFFFFLFSFQEVNFGGKQMKTLECIINAKEKLTEEIKKTGTKQMTKYNVQRKMISVVHSGGGY